MNRQIFTVAALLIATSAWSYEPTTHEDLSEQALLNSVVGKQQEVLQSFGIKDIKQIFPNSKGDDADVIQLVRNGARFEDNFPRSLNHFYDPPHDKGLNGVNLKSPDWALKDRGDADGQDFSYKNARQYLYDALTAGNDTDRKTYFGLTFQTLGQVIHHIQDMAQPQHVRNDAHCDIAPCKLFGAFNPSLYEKHTDKPEVRDRLPFTGYAPLYTDASAVVFTTPRKLWRTSPEGSSDISQGRGIAEYTNRNFLSAGTNFGTNLYPFPRLPDAVAKDENANELLQSVGVSIPPECLPPNDPCVITFFSTPVTDHYRPSANGVNPRTSTASIFDQDLQAKNLPPVFSLNRFNFDAAHAFLIPRAVAYSAGLIDYFFRGRLEGEDMEFTDTGLSLRVKNAIDPQQVPAWANETLFASSSTGPSQLVIAYEYKDTVGMKHYGVSNTASMPAGADIAPGQVSSHVYAFTFSIPQDAKDVKYRLVFRGKLGQEDVTFTDPSTLTRTPA